MHDGQRLRVRFGVWNVPIEEPLRCGPFLLEPVPNVKEIIDRLRGDSDSEMTAIGYFEFPGDAVFEQAWTYFRAQPIREMELLLSFVHRCQIQVLPPQLERLVDENWEWCGATTWHAQEGRAAGASFLFGHRALQACLDRAFPILSDPIKGEASGLRLALHMFCQNYLNDTVEMEYLKTWIALEVLYSRHFGTEEIVAEERAKPLRRALRETLKRTENEGLISGEERKRIVEKLRGLNRPSAKDQVLRYTAHIFSAYPAQIVTDSDVAEFIRIRNDITHGGVMKRRDGEDYADHLMHEHGRLVSLVTRVLLAVLGERPNLMEFSWEHYLAGA